MPLRTPTQHSFTRLPKWSLWVGGLVIATSAIVGIHRLTAPLTTTDTLSTTNLSHVKVSSVDSLSISTSSTPIVGTITSLNQATILSQTSGEITSLSHSLGDHITTGDVIAEFENSTQQANVLQAQGAYEATQTGLKNAQTTFANGSKITELQATQNVVTAQNTFSNTLQSTYTALDDAVHAKADKLFLNPRTTSVQIILTVPDSRLASLIKQERQQLQTTFATIFTAKDGIPVETISVRSTKMITAANSVAQFLKNLSTAVNKTSPSQSMPATELSGYTLSLAMARNEVNSALAGLIATKGAYDNAVAMQQTAKNASTNGTSNAIALAKARVRQASGAVDAARSVLEKTIVRSPINGTIVSLPITLGDYVPMFSPVAIVSNLKTLYIKTFVTSNTARALTVGGGAIINGSYKGKITFIAPSLNPLTRKYEVKVEITSPHKSLTNGQTVLIAFTHAPENGNSAKERAFSVPLSAIKVTPTGPEIFTVGTSSILTAHPVAIQTIEGDSVLLRTGVTSTTTIVLDARGLSSGQKVIVDTK